MKTVYNTLIRNEYDSEIICFTSADTTGNSERFECDLKDAADITFIVNTYERDDDITITFDAGTGPCGKEVTIKVGSGAYYLFCVPTAEIADDKGMAYFTLTGTAPLGTDEIQISVIKKRFVRNI